MDLKEWIKIFSNDKAFFEQENKNNPIIVRQVRSGCQQKVACINNMKQNFWEIDGNPVNLQDSHMHNCKIYSDTEDVSVCRNCCFKVFPYSLCRIINPFSRITAQRDGSQLTTPNGFLRSRRKSSKKLCFSTSSPIPQVNITFHLTFLAFS